MHFMPGIISPALDILKGSFQAHRYSTAGDVPRVAKQINTKLEFKNFKRL